MQKKMVLSVLRIIKYLILLGVRFYQVAVSPLFPPSCRHQPTCSRYMDEAIHEWGLFKGLIMGLKRLAKCHPWGTSGFDPVPRRPTDQASEYRE